MGLSFIIIRATIRLLFPTLSFNPPKMTRTNILLKPALISENGQKPVLTAKKTAKYTGPSKFQAMILLLSPKTLSRKIKKRKPGSPGRKISQGGQTRPREPGKDSFLSKRETVESN